MRKKEMEYKGKTYRVLIDTTSAGRLAWIYIEEKTDRKLFKWKSYTDDVVSTSPDMNLLQIVCDMIDAETEKRNKAKQVSDIFKTWDAWTGGRIDE